MTPTLVCSPLPWSVPLDVSRNRLRTCADGRAARRRQPLELFAGDGQERDRRSPRRGTRSCRRDRVAPKAQGTLRRLIFSERRLDELIEKRCNHYRQIMGCMLSEVSRNRPVIVGWSTANRPLIRKPINDNRTAASPRATTPRRKEGRAGSFRDFRASTARARCLTEFYLALLGPAAPAMPA